MDEAALTPAELAALREVSSEAPGSPQRPDTISLAAGDRQARRRMPFLANKLDVLHKRMRWAVGRAVRKPVELAWEAPSLAGPLVMKKEVESWLMGAVLRQPDNLEPVAWLGVAPALGYHLIEVAFGGVPFEPGPVPSRLQMTPLERDILWPFLADAASELMGALALGQLEAVPTGYPIQFGAQRTQESGVVFHAQLAMGTTSVPIAVVLAPKALERIGSANDASHQDHLVQARQNMLAHVQDAEVEIVATLGLTQMSVGGLMALNVGQTIWLEHTQTQPIDISVEGHSKFTAMPMQRAGALGVQIIARTS